MARVLKELSLSSKKMNDRYETFSRAIIGNFFIMLHSGRLSPADIYAMDVRNAKEVQGMMHDASVIMENGIAKIESMLISKHDHYLPYSVKNKATNAVLAAINKQIIFNIKSVHNEASVVSIRASRRRSDQNISRSDSVSGAMYGVSFKFVDSIGRHWEPRNYINAIVRKSLIDVYVSAYAEFASMGFDIELTNGDVIPARKFKDSLARFHPNTSTLPLLIK